MTLLALWTQPAFSGDFLLFGPTYVRSTGKPVTTTNTFQVTGEFEAYRLRIRNQGVLSGVVTLNGRTIFRPADFDATGGTGTLERAVTIHSGVNRLTVELRSAPGSSIILEVIGVDTTPPTITATAAPPANSSGWNDSTVTVSFACADNGSGIASCPAPIAVEAEGAKQVVSGAAVDKAGNAASVGVTVNIDRTAPSVTAAVAPAPNTNGWNNGPVVVTFDAADALSGVTPGSVTPSITLSTDGANLSATGQATDRAGNVGSVTQSGINIDTVPPTVTITFPTNGAVLTTGTVTVVGVVSDALSGVASATCNGANATIVGSALTCPVTLTPGPNVITVMVTDVAGNTTPTTLNVTFQATLGPKVAITAPANLAYLNITPTTVTGTVDDAAATVTVNGIAAPLVNGTFSLAVPVTEGPNVITATATASGRAGTASVTVTLDTTPPKVTITSPAAGFTTTEASIAVAGTVNDIVVGTVNEQQARVTVNSIAAQVSNRQFLAPNVPLSLGANVIQAIGTDRIGNAVTTEITVTRQALTAEPRIQVVSGSGQIGTIGTVLPAPLVVALTDAAGNPVANQPVIFKVTQNDGLIATTESPAPSLMAKTDAQGRGQAQWTLGHRAGAGANVVEAYAVGYTGTAVFVATGTQGVPGKIVVDTGNTQLGAIGQVLPKPFIAVVVDEGNNRLGGVPVTFTVREGGGSFAGQQSVTATSDPDGRVEAVLTLGLQEGNANNLVDATYPSNQGFPAAFTASGRAPGDPAQTTISGVVLDNSSNPIPGGRCTPSCARSSTRI